jgi:Raf kinase inhibitor-like YbhB/YbcL family protein
MESGMVFRLRSNDLKEGERLPDAQVFNGMGYVGGNLSPHLAWDDPPEGTKSFVVTLYDPDAPTGSGWWHWIVANIPGSIRELPAGIGHGSAALPKGALETRTDFGSPGYGGAAPPGTDPHRYVFTVHALKTEKIDVTVESSGALVGFMTHLNSLGKASITTTFGRSTSS